MAADVASSPMGYGKRQFNMHDDDVEDNETQMLLKRVRYDSQQALNQAQQVPPSSNRTIFPQSAPKRTKFEENDSPRNQNTPCLPLPAMMDFAHALEQQRLAFEKEILQLRSRCEATLLQKCEENKILKRGITVSSVTFIFSHYPKDVNQFPFLDSRCKD